MPTGYTHDVQTGKVTDFRTFALRCARAFGACVMQRDENGDVPPKPREESTYYAEALDRARTRLKYLSAMTVSEAAAQAQASYTDAMAAHHQRQRQQAEEQSRYATMLAAATAWIPPTPDHVGLKQFMIQQLTNSAKFDAFDATPPVFLSGGEWLTREVAKASRDVKYYREEWDKEQQRVAESNAWIRALEESLAETLHGEPA